MRAIDEAVSRRAQEPAAPAASTAGILLAALPVALLVALRPWGLELPVGVYLPVHTLLEVLVAAACAATFAVQWFAAGAGAFREARARFIGPLFLGVAALETLHLLSFPGMPGLLGASSTERGIHYWLAARILTVGALLASVGARRISRSPLLHRARLLSLTLAGVALFAVFEVTVLRGRSLFFVEGQGLTRLKIGIEALVASGAVAGAFLYSRERRRTGDATSGKLAAALSMTALSETCFMLYAHPYDLFNVVGHAYLAVALGFVFDALFVAALVRPYHELDALRAHVEDELEVTIQRLRDTTEQREDLLRAVSHDLRNPLQVVLLHGERLQRIVESDPARRTAASILSAARRMERLLRDLVDSAHSDGQLQLSVQPIELRAFVDSFADAAGGALEVSRLDNEVPPDLAPVLADPDRLERILVNLVGNALKYSRGRVVVGAARDGDSVRISVSDRGAGIAEEDLPRVFERYYRGQRHEGEGLGLGLYIVRKLVEAHGGRIWAESRAGEGSTFSFTLAASAGGQSAAS